MNTFLEYSRNFFGNYVRRIYAVTTYTSFVPLISVTVDQGGGGISFSTATVVTKFYIYILRFKVKSLLMVFS